MFLGLRFNESKDIEEISNLKLINPKLFFQFILTAMIPAIAGFIGFYYFGWLSPSGNIITVSKDLAIVLSISSFIGYLFLILAASMVIYLTKEIYNAKISSTKSLIFAYYCSIPFLIASITLIYPYMPLNLVALCIAIAYSIKLLYTDLHLISGLNREQAFLYASTILTGVLISFVFFLIISVIIYINIETSIIGTV